MEKVCGFIVRNRIKILIVMLILSAVCAFLMTKVYINTDMSKYLPDDSNMKQGVDVMAEEFADNAMANTIRVMFTGLDEADIPRIQAELEQIEHVTGVEYEADSEDYNRGEHTLFILSTTYDYGSDEETAIQKAVLNQYADLEVTVKNDSTNTGVLPAWVIVMALILGMAILCVMCRSWAEPLLFLAALGMGVLINMGTNIFLGSISTTTFMIAAILQLVLSMDYSIILMSRYRQERLLTDDRNLAMTIALSKAFPSICSSCLTTAVGLIMLVFMKFKIGFDIGVVLAKGVILGMVCALTVLPGLILSCEGLITKTEKKEPAIPLYKLAGGGFRFRKWIVPLALLLFVGGLIFQSRVDTTYSLYMEDPIKEIFPQTNPVVLLYNNEDEAASAALAAELEQNENVESVLSYSTTLGKELTSEEMLDTVEQLGADMELDASMLDLLYYDYHTGGALPEVNISELLAFISQQADAPALSGYLDGAAADQLAMLEQFSDPAELTVPRTSGQMADLFDMNAGDLEDLYLLYFIRNGGVNTGTMTLPQFVNFILNDVANDPTYGAMFDAGSKAQLQQLAAFTNVAAVTTPQTYTQLAQTLGIDAAQMYLLLVCYQAGNSAYTPSNLTLPAFTAFLQSKAADPTFASLMDAAALAQVGQLAAFTDAATIQTPMDAQQLAQLLQMDAAQVEQILCLYYGTDTGTMTLTQFTGFVTGTVMADPTYSAMFDEATKAQLTGLHQMLTVAASGTSLPYGQMAALLGMDATLCKQLYCLYYGDMDLSGHSMSLNGFLSFLLSDPTATGNMDPAQLTQLQSLYQITSLGASGQALDAAALAAVTGIPAANVQQIFQAQSMATGQTVSAMSLGDFLAVMCAPPYSQSLPAAQLAQLQMTQQLVQTAASGAALTPVQLSQILGMEQAAVAQIFLLYFAPQQTMRLDTFTGFVTGTVMADPVYGAQFDAATKAQLTGLHQMISLAAVQQALPAAQCGQIFGMDASLTALIYRWYDGAQNPGKTLSPLQLIDLLLSDPLFSANLGAEQKAQLTYLQTLMQAALSGKSFSPAELAALLQMEEGTIRLLYTYHDAQYRINSWKVSLQKLINFLLSSSDVSSMLPSDSRGMLQMAQSIINASVSGARYSPMGMANLLGLPADQAQQLYLLYQSRYGDTSSWQLSTKNFVDFLVSDVLSDPTLAANLDDQTASMLTGLQRLIHAILSGETYSAEDLTPLLQPLSAELDQTKIELLYLYYAGCNHADPAWTMSIRGLFNHLDQKILADERFAGLLDEATRNQIADTRVQLDDAVAQMQGEHYALMMIDTTLPVESPETSAFMAMLHQRGDTDLGGDYYLIGSSAMNYEMEQSFDREMRTITLLTALAIFLVVAFTFRSVIIPLILVLLVQCGVYLTITASGILGYSIYYLAMLIVQCILMGATIDYAIVFTNYYRDSRQNAEIRDALVAAYKGSTHTILTSGLVIIIVTAIIAVSPADATIGQICQTLSIGALMACLLILLILPGLLAAFDKLIVRKKAEQD